MRDEVLSSNSKVVSGLTPPEEAGTASSAGASGDVPGFEQIFAGHYDLVYAVALRILGSPEDAEDVTQEVFTKVWKGLGDFNRDAALRTWIYRITINTCIDYGRKPWKRFCDLNAALADGLDESEGSPLVARNVGAEDQLLADETAAQLRVAIRRLKPHLKAVLVMKELEELSYDEISSRLGLSMGTISSRLNRARHALQEAFRAVVPALGSVRLAEQS